MIGGEGGVKATLENGVVDNVRGRRAAKSPPPPWAPPVEMRTGHFVTLTTITLRLFILSIFIGIEFDHYLTSPLTLIDVTQDD